MPLPVLIIGSGLGGLTLAHALKKHDIPYRLFERDAAESQRAQGYRFGLDSVGVDGLREVLPADLFERFEATCGAQHPPGGRVDGPSGKVIQSGILGLIGAGGWGMIWELGIRFLLRRWQNFTWSSLWSSIGPQTASGIDLTIPPGPDNRYQVDRRMLRSILLSSHSSLITYESAFTRYTTSENSVIAHFANGTSAEGSLLVGADGVRSKVAAQLVGDEATPIDLGFRIIYGKTPLTPGLGEELHATLRKGVSFVVDKTVDGHSILMVMESMRFSDVQAPNDYIFWALTARSEVFDAYENDGSNDDNRSVSGIARHFTSNWHPSIKCVVDKQDITQTASLKMSSSNPEKPTTWTTNPRVTLLGDAIHCMPPTGGQGANLAMRDAAILGLALKSQDADVSGGWNRETIRTYEDTMRYNMGDIVGMACIGIRRIVT